MRAVLLGLAAIVVAGCGGDTANPLAETTWSTQINSTDLLAVSFHADYSYTEGTVFALMSGATGADLERGVYNVQGDKVTFLPTAASCPSHDHSSETDSFRIAGATLTIDLPSGAVFLSRSATDTTSPSGGTITYGCNEGTSFTPHDIVPL